MGLFEIGIKKKAAPKCSQKLSNKGITGTTTIENQKGDKRFQLGSDLFLSNR